MNGYSQGPVRRRTASDCSTSAPRIPIEISLILPLGGNELGATTLFAAASARGGPSLKTGSDRASTTIDWRGGGAGMLLTPNLELAPQQFGGGVGLWGE